MFQKLEIFQVAHAMARHAGQRQAVSARNMANADTPGYRAKDITPFKETVAQKSSGAAQRATRDGHINGVQQGRDLISPAAMVIDETAITDPNGNSVSVENEILRSIEAKRQHDRALAIYRSSLTILRTSLGRGG